MRKLFKFIFSFFILTLTSLSFSAWSLPYEANCSEPQKERTRQFSPSETEAGFCIECDYSKTSAENLSALKNFNLIPTIPKKCFLAIATRGNHIFDNRYNYCSKETNPSPIKGRFCINEDYITAVHETFKKMSFCFGFDQKVQNDLFFMINHESGGVLNARSSTGARCLGQITQGYVKTINNIINSTNRKRPDPESYIWADLLSRCPDLESSRINLNSITCEATQNPEKCLLYSFFGKKRSLNSIQDTLDSTHGYMGNREFPTVEKALDKEILPNTQQAQQKYQNMLSLLPMKQKEMLIIKATLNNGKKVNWVMWDDTEIYDRKIHSRIDWTQEVEIKKTDLFQNERDIKAMFMYWGHNGGETISKNGFKTRLRKLKQSIAGGCKPKNKQLRCQMRRKIESGEKVPNALALEFFQQDLSSSYPSKSSTRRNEVSNYVTNIIKDRNSAFGVDEASRQNLYKKYYKKNDIEKTDALQFLRTANSKCPKPLKI